jgi:hypothetical protein
VTDCATPNVCDPSGNCVAPSGGGGSSGGCTASSRSSSVAGPWALLLGALLGLRGARSVSATRRRNR